MKHRNTKNIEERGKIHLCERERSQVSFIITSSCNVERNWKWMIVTGWSSVEWKLPYNGKKYIDEKKISE